MHGVLPRAARARACSSRSRTSAPPGSPPRPSEMASAGGVGIDIDVARVPLRKPDLEPFEMMVSESQERMLAVVEPERRRRGARDLREAGRPDGTVIGEVTDGGPRSGSFDGGEVRSATCRSQLLVDECPLYDLEPGEPGGLDLRQRGDARRRTTRAETLLALLGSPTIASKRWAFEQYDSIVSRAPCAGRSRPTPRCCSSPRPAPRSRSRSTATAAASPAIPTRERSRPCSSAPSNLACVGAEPLGLTNCLNFGNPEKPAVAWQLDRSIQGLADACNGARRPGRRRQRLALQRDRPRPDLPDPGRRHGRRAARPRARRRGRRARRRRRDRARRPLPPVARGLGAGEAARRARTRAARASTIAAVAAAIAASARRCATARVAGRPRRQRRRPRLRARRDGDRRRRRARGRPRRPDRRRAAAAAEDVRSSARGRAASSSPATEASSRRSPPLPATSTCFSSARAGGERICGSPRPRRELELDLAEAESAWRSLGDRVEAT